MNTELEELAESVFGDAASSATGFDAELWKTLEGTGLARLTLPADAGGSEGTFADAAVVLAAAGAHAARVPLVETDLLAGWLLHAAGVPLPPGPLTAVAGELAVDGTRVRGELRRWPC
jgi:acyl-CoA dehydrogenase